MRVALVVGLALGGLACSEQADGNVSAPEVTMVGGQRRTLVGGNPAAPGQTNRPLDGSGTPNVVPMWITPTMLGDAPMKVAPNGDVFVQPGKAIWVLSIDGSKCRRIAADVIQTYYPPNCPTY